ncbi:MAG: acyl-CoA dehydrogenase, partial [Coxiellaceae bacterium]|nr:acyl-CoA dehydrogenase [Coxiellaceae bacterium]
MLALIGIIIFVVGIGALAYHRASLAVWSIGVAALLAIIIALFAPTFPAIITLAVIYILIFGILNLRPLRRYLISNSLLKIYRKMMPSMSSTEKAALESGGVGWEGDLFSGMPSWGKLREMPLSQLSEEEQEFLDGPVEEVCRLIDSWEIAKTMEIPEQIWSLLKSSGFFGMIIPKSYGGKGFSAFGHAQVILKLASTNVAVATVASVPNSLGPGELLLRYGTEEQKNHYLPRLASGEEVPCFALTSPVAGSDAGSLTDTGIVCRHMFEGREQLCLRLNWNKRYITLSPVATLIGLAFKCYDPDGLLGDEEELGITCALIPVHMTGVVTGRRHFPLHSAFPNGPTRGENVLIPLDWVIGGPKMVGQGWRMLMECLAAGRSISLPSMVVSNAKRGVLASGAYARIRRQFNTSLSDFEGVQEAMAHMAGHAYQAEALRVLTLSVMDQGEVPAVASAISKYHATELSRTVINDAMDVHGGKGICMGPNNYLAQNYIETPIGITVEGANILTRSMMIYGQGAIRCHPYLLKEIEAASNNDTKQATVDFDRAFFSHIGFMISNKVRSFCLGLSNGRGSCSIKTPLKRYYQLFTRFSSVLAFISDATTIMVGAQLKRREMLSSRLGDILSMLYIGSSVLKFYEDKNEEKELPLARWACKELLYRIQTQLDGLIANLPNVFFRFYLRIIIFPRGKMLQPPSDELTRGVATLLCKPGVVRERFTDGIYYTPNTNNPVAKMEDILLKSIAVEPIEKKVMKAKKDGLIKGKDIEELAAAAATANV